MKLLRASIPATIKFKIAIDKNCPPVVADATQIYQIIINLCTNAYQAMPENQGTLSVSLKQATIDIADVNNFTTVVPGEYVLLRVSDTGIGMKSDIIQRIFDPFFSTKKKEHGTGLRLSVVLFTGLSENPDEGKSCASGIRTIVIKPVLKTDLANAVWKVLHEI